MFCSPWAKGTCSATFQGTGIKKSPYSSEHRLSWLASIVNLTGILAWKVSFAFADSCKHLAKLWTHLTIHDHLCLYLSVFSDLAEISFAKTFQVVLRMCVDNSLIFFVLLSSVLLVSHLKGGPTANNTCTRDTSSVHICKLPKGFMQAFWI